MDRNLEIARLAHSQALQGLAGQEVTLNSVQQRAAANIAIAGITVSLLGTQIFKAKDYAEPSILTIVAAALFVLSVALSIIVLKPRNGWTFHQSASVICENYITNHPGMPLVEVYISLATFLEENFEKNNTQLKFLFETLNVAFFFTAVHIFLLIVVLATSPGSAEMANESQPKPQKPQTQQPAPQNPIPPLKNPGVDTSRTTIVPPDNRPHIKPADR